MSQPSVTFEDRVGLLFTVEGATLSICAVTVILLYALYKWVRTWQNKEPDFEEASASDSILFLNLMLADLIQGIGTMPNIKWLSDGFITEGSLCTAQAAIKQVGIDGVALTSLFIALYTFIVLVARKERNIPKHTAKFIVVFIWVFTALIVGVPHYLHRKDEYYGPTQFWCWILPTFQNEQIYTEYFWVWFTGLFMILLYPIMFLLMRGWIGGKQAEGPLELRSIGQQGVVQDASRIEAEITKKVAQKMLYYPLIYTVCVLPNSASRWMWFKIHYSSSRFTFTANTLFALSGLFNFILFFITRRSWVVGPRRQDEHHQQPGTPSRPFGRPPPDSPHALRKDSDGSVPRDDDYIQLHNRFVPPGRRSSGQGFLPP